MTPNHGKGPVCGEPIPESFEPAPTPEEFFRLIAENTTDLVTVHSPDGVVLWASPSARAVLGYEPSELVGRPLQDMVPTGGPVGATEAATDVRISPDEHRSTARVRRNDGVIFWLESSTRMLRDPRTGEALYLLSVGRDVTQRVRLTDELRDANEELRRIDASRVQLLSNAAHDLSNSMTPILLGLPMLRPAVAPPTNGEFATSMETITRYVDQMCRVVEEVRDLARIQRETLAMSVRPVDLTELVRDVAEEWRGKMERKGLRFEVRARGHAPVKADPRRLRQVLTNLLANGWTFTPAGGEVELRSAADQDHAFVSIRDTGIGIPPDAIELLFEPFSHVHDPTAVEGRGPGLGLYVCKEIVERHGGRVWAVSPGTHQGSTFTVSLPLQAARAGRGGAPKASLETPQAARTGPE